MLQFRGFQVWNFNFAVFELWLLCSYTAIQIRGYKFSQFDVIHEIREIKMHAKISCYTVVPLNFVTKLDCSIVFVVVIVIKIERI